MIKPEILRHLSAWQAAMHEMDKQYDALHALTGITPESPCWKAVGDLQNLLTEKTAELCAIGTEWLMAWWLEHDFGAKPMEAGLVGEAMREIRTLGDLVTLICDDAETTA